MSVLRIPTIAYSGLRRGWSISPTLMAGVAYIYELSNVSEPGCAGAGMVARANDADTVFTHPAGMTRFTGRFC